MTETAGRAAPPHTAPEPNPSIAQLVQRATEQGKRLVRAEIALAKAELSAKGKAAATGIGLFAGGGLLLLYGLAALIAAAVLALALVLPAWLAALIVGVALFLIAAVLFLMGRASLRRSTPLAPTEAVESVHADVETLKARVHR